MTLAIRRGPDPGRARMRPGQEPVDRPRATARVARRLPADKRYQSAAQLAPDLQEPARHGRAPRRSFADTWMPYPPRWSPSRCAPSPWCGPLRRRTTAARC